MNRYVSKTNSILNLNKTNIIGEDVLSAADYRLEDYNSALIKEVIIDKLESIIFVASSLPPKPTSNIA